jgi:hypothetical protein
MVLRPASGGTLVPLYQAVDLIYRGADSVAWPPCPGPAHAKL